MPCCEISDCAQMSKTIIAVRHFGLGGRESLETAVIIHENKQMVHPSNTFSGFIIQHFSLFFLS